MILVISNSFDKTVDYIVETYSKDCDFFRLNVDMLHEYEIDYSSGHGLRITKQHESTLNEDQISSIYYRKLIFTDIPGFDSRYYGFQRSEVYGFINGFVNQFQKKVLTKPNFLNFADNKIVQLQQAKYVGLNVPPTHITNSARIVQSFAGPLIVKPIVRGKIQDGQTVEIIHTNKLNKMYDLQTLKYCPSIFQEYVRKEYEIRLTVIDGTFYPVKISAKDQTKEIVDWRNEIDNIEYDFIDLPDSLKSKCIKLMESLNINFGAFDFIFSGDDYYFLEVNANGQWLWLEIELGLDISQKLVQYLNS